jgi:lysozyme
MTTFVDGIDVSHYQGAIDWQKVAGSGVKFAFAKAAEGDTVTDSQFSTNWSGMAEAGLLRGAYDFYTVGSDPNTQAQHFLDRVKLVPGDLPPMVDIETEGKAGESDSGLITDLRRYIDILSRAYGTAPFIYTGPGFWNDHLNDSFGDCPLWVAEYGVSSPKAVSGWSYWSIWQYSQTGSVPGVSGDVDLDYFNGTLDQLKRFVLT